MTDFELDPRLALNHHVVDWPLCTVLLEDDARFPWLVLVPRRPNLREIYNLTEADRAQFFHEVNTATERLAKYHNPSKMNVAMLGNMVPQLHAHVIARFATDPAWPGPVWNIGHRRHYDADEIDARLEQIREVVGKAP